MFEEIKVFKFIAGDTKGLWRLLFTHADNVHSTFPEAHRQPREVTVRRGKAESIEVSGIEQVHRVDDHGGIGRVLSGGVTVLLDGLDRMPQQYVLPLAVLGGGPVPVDALAEHGSL